VLTNDFHRLAFDMDISGTLWDYEYSYGPVFYISAAAIFLQFLLSQIIMVQKSRQSPRKGGYLFLIALYLLTVLFCAACAMRLPIAFNSDITVVAGVFTMLYMEACAGLGFMPVNRNYRRFFTHSPNNMQILTSAGDTALASASSAPPDASVWKGFCENPDEPQAAGENELLFAGRINGGMVVWREDISSINRLLGEINISTEQPRRTNALLEQKSVIRGRLVASQARISLFSALETEIRRQSEKLSQMLHNIPAGEGRKAYIAEAALPVCYIKRRCHLFFLEKNNEETTAGELIIYMEELAEYAGVSGLSCLCNCLLTGPVLTRQAALMYDLFYALLAWQFEHIADDMPTEAREGTEDDENGVGTLCKIYGELGVKIEIIGEMPENAAHRAFYNHFASEGIAKAVLHGLATEVLLTCTAGESGTAVSVMNNSAVPAGGIIEGSGITELRRKANHPEDYLAICDVVKSIRPNCKLILMCPENSSESKQAAVEAMRSGRIDEFMYYNVSMDYLESKLEVLSAGHSDAREAAENNACAKQEGNRI